MTTAPALSRNLDAGGRLVALDVIRGVALCGILFVNIGPLTQFGYADDIYEPTNFGDPSGWLQLFIQQRFFPIFALLFGIGFSMFLDSATQRAVRPRVLLLRRLLLLLAIGIPFAFLQPGSALLPFALAGLVVLLPSTWLPRWATAAAAAALIAASLIITEGGITLIPGIFLLGSCLTRYGIIHAVGRSRRGSLFALIGFSAPAIPLTAWSATTIENAGFDLASALAGLAIAGVYFCLLSLLMTTNASRILGTVFAPLGKIALTNYVSAAPLMLAAGALLDLPHSTSYPTLLISSAVILVAQWIASTLWLRKFTQGPLEWLWRWGTWGLRGPFRRSTVALSARLGI